MPTDERPFVWAGYGLETLIYTTWSARSLARFHWPRMHFITADGAGQRFLRKRLAALPGDISFEVVPYPHRADYGGFCFKPWALARSEAVAAMRDGFVFCDGDVLVNQDPRPVFAAAGPGTWFHKLDWNKVPEDQSALTDPSLATEGTAWRTIAALAARHGGVDRIRYFTNSGFFALPADVAPRALDRWSAQCFELEPGELISDQEVLTVVLHQLGIEPVCDKAVNYPMARHYLSDLKPQLVKDARAAGLDHDRLRLRLLGARLGRLARRLTGR